LAEEIGKCDLRQLAHGASVDFTELSARILARLRDLAGGEQLQDVRARDDPPGLGQRRGTLTDEIGLATQARLERSLEVRLHAFGWDRDEWCNRRRIPLEIVQPA